MSNKIVILFCCVLLYGFMNGFAQSSLSSEKSSNTDDNLVWLSKEIDKIVHMGLDSGAYPGCQVLVAKNGSVVIEKAYGYHTYDKVRPVLKSDLYDLASITKVAAGTLALMKMYDDGRLDLDATLGSIFPILKHSNKKKLTIREVLSHQAGLEPWISYHQNSLMKNGRFKRKTLSYDSLPQFPFKMAESGPYIHKKFRQDKIFRAIKKSDLHRNPDYLYSGLSFYLWPSLIEAKYGMSFDQFLRQQFYDPLKLSSMRFKPTFQFDLNQIVPTEYDSIIRKSLVHGTVHDEGAALMNGISSNAGLFSNAHDLAVLFQMLLNGGAYDGKQYLKPYTISKFTNRHFNHLNNHRGLGFDKPLFKYDSVKSSVSSFVSENSFGHLGFTGTQVLADPTNDLIFVFLSNRVYPTRENRKLYQMRIRQQIQDLAYLYFTR